MNIRLRIELIALILLAGLAPACSKEDRAAKSPENARPLYAVRFPSDLGPSAISVDDYPEDVRRVYPYFMAVCSSCHMPARALHAPIIERADWKRYVHRMHVRYESQGFVLAPALEKDIVDFLTYDAKVRKVDGARAFARQRGELELAFQALQKERERLTLDETLKAPKTETPYVGVK